MSKAVIIAPESWKYSQMSIAARYGGIKIQGDEYFVDGASNYLVRHDWVGVVNAVGIERTKELIHSGYRTASSAMTVIRKERAEKKQRERDFEEKQPKLF